jgi:adenylate cyclase
MRFIFFILSFFLVTGLIQSQDQPVTDSLILVKLKEAKKESAAYAAILFSQQALLEAKQNKLNQATKAGLRQLSELYAESKNTVQALRYGLEYLSWVEDLENEERYFANLHLGNIYFVESFFSAAINYYKTAIEFKPDSVEQLSLLIKIGNAFFSDHQLDSAAVYFQEQWEVYHEREDYSGELKTLQQLAKVFEERGDYRNALQYYRVTEQLIYNQKDTSYFALIHNNLGYQYHRLKDYKNAIDQFEAAADFCLDDCQLDKITLFSNLGIAYFNAHQFVAAVRLLEEALEVAEARKDLTEIARLENLIAKVYLKRGELYEALQRNNFALTAAERSGQNEILRDAYLTEANIYEALYEFDKALDFYQKHLALRDSLLVAELLRKEKLLQDQFSLERSEKEIKLLLVNQKVQDLAIEQLQLEKENLALESSRKENELALLRQEQEIREERLHIEQLEALKTKQALELTQQLLEAAEKDKQISALQQTEALQALELKQREAEEEAQRQEIKALNKEKELQRLEIERQNTFKKFIYGLLTALFIILMLILAGYIFGRRANRKLKKQKEQIEHQKTLVESEQSKSERLLLNILPEETAAELKQQGFATPRHYEKVSVLFADFVNFTKLTEKMPPEQLIRELNHCFSTFDEIIERYDLEKIKTIGDAYMCAGGIPTANDTNPEDAVNAAVEMMTFIEERFEKADFPFWKMRIGIHTGPVVAGVVGNRKFAYDIWGDTVNLASRMESHSEPGRINISEATFLALENKFRCIFRGEIPIKHKANTPMYFVEK